MKFKRWNWIIILGMIAANIIFYPFMPAKMAVKIGFNGEITRFMAKELGLLIIPGIAVLVTLINSKDEEKRSRELITSVFLFIVNLGINIFNIVRL